MDTSIASGNRLTAEQRRAIPNLHEIAQATAEKFDVCQRPIPMRIEDPKTGTVTYEGAPCKSTMESVCPACAKANRALRIQQCREGWHIASEPVEYKPEPTEAQTAIIAARSDLAEQYRAAVADGDEDAAAGIKEVVADLDAELRELGVRGRLPSLDETGKDRRRRSTRRRQDVPDLPRRKVEKRTLGKEIGGYLSSMFVTLTMPSYGRINQDGATDDKGKPCSDGSPVNPSTYDYQRQARDAVFCSKLVDRWMQNLRRAVGWDVQYFAVVEPQKRGAPHLHILIRGAISRELLKQVTAATYHQVWWPRFDAENRVYGGDYQPVWDHRHATFVDPTTHQPLTFWDDALDILDSVDDLEPAHVVRFGIQMDRQQIKGVIAEKAGKTIGYVTKYLTKSISEIVEPRSDRAADHYDRLHAELQNVPCSPRCPVWLEYGIVPQGATGKTIPGRCKGKAHRRDTLGMPGRRVLVSRRWTGKTLPDHKADRAEFVRQLLAEVGIQRPDTSHLRITPVEAGDKQRPLREHLIMGAIAKRSQWRAEYLMARMAAGPDGPQQTSATQQAA
ncbi:helitron helicase-like domain-containing protein [Nocardia nova]|uniref:helitron helicase-like domain-containing protein n=1 Tax=Nocardia nova TaxID=37330 RepID=UPI001C445D1C|nr:helitron helicase-like domain-containing protein [Nocardia nova]MBV7704643.1 helitron helicase-like domain-containing protein [Nocardia nova]